MRLIDADKLTKEGWHLVRYGKTPIHEETKKIEDIPTAYDPDKVVKQLEEDAMKWESVHSQGGFIDLDKAIEIVKGGVSNE